MRKRSTRTEYTVITESKSNSVYSVNSVFKFLLCVLILQFFLCEISNAQKFYPDDPILVDHDRKNIPQPPDIEVSQIYDFSYNTFYKTRDKNRPPAANINTLGEVPDSTWFTNRLGVRSMTIEEFVRASNQVEGPDMSAPWQVLRGKTQGITPGCIIKDGRGDIYFVKFDPKDFPQLSTSAEVISTKFFYAFGYNVPENYLVTVNVKQFQLAPDASFRDVDGKKRKMKYRDLKSIFSRVSIAEDGTMQIVASRALPGKPIGPFLYTGTRSDDTNDIFPHEDRRELRGMRIFAEWLNHDDSRSINSYDTYVTENGNSFIRHYLIDFGSTLGSGSVAPQTHRAGNEYLIEWPPIFKASATFGIWDRPWRNVKYPYYEYLGRIEADYFQPELWKPEYPNPAFDRMRSADAFWAIRILLRVTDEMVRAGVEAGQIRSKDAQEYLIQTLMKRKQKIVQYYLSLLNPLDEFHINGRELTFRNLGESAGLGNPESYEYQWFVFNNDTGETKALGATEKAMTTTIPVPDATADFLMVRIQSLTDRQPNWRKNVDIYLRTNQLSSAYMPPGRDSHAAAWDIIGIERAE